MLLIIEKYAKKRDYTFTNKIFHQKTYSETTLQQTPSGPQNSVRYREVSTT